MRVKLLFLALLLFVDVSAVRAHEGHVHVPISLGGEDIEESTSNLNDRIKELEDKVEEAQDRKRTLSSQVSLLDDQIRLTSLRIDETRNEIAELQIEIGELGKKIKVLEASLDGLTELLLQRIVTTYKARKLSFFSYLFSANSVGDFLRRGKYIATAQAHDKRVLFEVQETKVVYGEQKNLREDKKQELETLQARIVVQQQTLIEQKEDKETLLQVTKQDERRFQELLAAARAELAVVFGGGKETFLREVNEGDVIGSVIPSSSGCSSGQHLHFEVHKNGNIDDPNNYLKSIEFTYSYSDTSRFGSIDPRGNLRWPIEQPISVNQGYGSSHSFARQFYPNGVHNGIDIDSPDRSIKAVKNGKLYAGSFECEGSFPGTLLYAKVTHDDGLVTWYLHITPS